jgi:hypothetical protein
MRSTKIKLDDLSETTLKALDFFAGQTGPEINLDNFNFPLVIGSGNAYNTAKILFSRQAALFADESDLKAVIKKSQPLFDKKIIREALVISASGEKDSVWELQLAKKIGLKTTLFTCSPQSSAAKIADKVVAFRKLPEPYTYNVSTYLGMILSATGENPALIKKSLLYLQTQLPKNFNRYRAYSFIVPDELGTVCPMLDIKKSELFGARLSLRAFSYGEARHAKFVIPDEKELVISFGPNRYFGLEKNRWEIDLPKNAAAGWLMSVTYFLIGLIQKKKPAYYKKNIAGYCRDYGYKAYHGEKPFDIIVPGN